MKTIQELGHRDFKMTMRYSRLTAAHKRNAVEMLNKVPDGITAFFTTEGVDRKNRKVVNIGNR